MKFVCVPEINPNLKHYFLSDVCDSSLDGRQFPKSLYSFITVQSNKSRSFETYILLSLLFPF